MTFQENLKKLRLEKDLTQEELANKIFVSRTLITKYENGTVMPTKDNLEKLALFFNVDTKELLSSHEETGIVLDLEDRRQKTEFIISLIMISISIIVAIIYLLPIFVACKYVYPIPDGAIAPTRVCYNFAIMNSCLFNHNYICLISEIVIVINVIILLFSIIISNKKAAYTLKVIGFIMFVVSLFLMLFSFVCGISFLNSLDY